MQKIDVSEGVRVDSAKLKQLVSDIFMKAGLAPIAAEVVADHLVLADLRGAGTHGVTRVASYVGKIRSNELNASPQIRTTLVGPSLLKVDADRGLGAVVGYQVVRELMSLAAQQGIGGALISNVGHLGALGLFTLPAIEQDMAIFLVQYTPAVMALPGMSQAVVGNNPIAFGFPGGTDSPVIVDMSCSVVARGNILLAQRHGMSIPEGWAIDSSGRPTTNPKDALQGMLLPFGNYKGLAMALFGDLFAGILTEAVHSSEPLTSTPGLTHTASSGVGCFMTVLDINKILARSIWTALVDEWRQKFHTRAGDMAHIPGELSARLAKQQMISGVEILQEVYEELLGLARALGIPDRDIRITS